MSRTIIAGAMLALTLATAGAAQASPATDEFGRCLVRATSPADKTSLMVWVFTALAAHPAVRPYATVTDAQRAEVSASTARLLERLVTQDCRKETVAAMKSDGPSSIQQAFTVLGQVAVGGLAQDPAVSKAMMAVTTQLDMAKFQSLALEMMNAGAAPK
jgi:hypothetical protein